MLKYHSLLTILVFTFCLLGFLVESSSDTPNPNSNTTCQDMLNYTRAEFSIDICLMKQGSQYAAKISLQSNDTSDVYELKVSQSYIDQNAQMTLLYLNPYRFFSILKHDECNITTNSIAQISIKYKLFRMLKLTLRKQTLDKTDRIKRQLQARKTLINRIRQQSNSEIMMLNNNITQISSQMDLLRSEQEAQIAQAKNERLSLIQTIEAEKQSNKLKSNQIKQIESLLFYGSLQRINNQNLAKFTILNSNKNLQIKKKSSGWYGFLRTPYIQARKITRLQVRQTKTTNKDIIYGVSTDKTMGMQNPYTHLEFRSYHGIGLVWQNGNSRAAGAAINDGTVVTIIADLINWKISWEVNGNKLAEVEISAAMRANKLYFIISMFNQNDEAEILDY